MMMQKEQVGLFILRVSLGLFLLLWSLDKLVVPEGTVKIFTVFYHLSISPAVAYVIGAVEAVLIGQNHLFIAAIPVLAAFIFCISCESRTRCGRSTIEG